MKWVLLSLGILTNAGASLLVKKAMSAPRRSPGQLDLWAVATGWPFWLGLILYGTAFLVYAIALTRLPINVAHPILTSGAIAVVAIGSVAFFRESFRLSTLMGIGLVAIGVALISLKSV